MCPVLYHAPLAYTLPVPQVGHDAAEATGGTMATTELEGHTDSVVSLAFNASGQRGGHAGSRAGRQHLTSSSSSWCRSRHVPCL
jgi:hypothetical protein